MTETSAQLFVKWAGGKRQLLEQIKAGLPKHFNGYMEPFVGGSAVHFDLQLEKSIIGDINESLTNAYLQVEVPPGEFIDAASEYDKRIADGGKEYYYGVRGNYNDKMMRAKYDMELAVSLVFLNKHCLNDFYRVNGRGLFNVPYNDSVREFRSKESTMAVLQSLQEVKIMKGDFQNVCDLVEKGDFVFIDSPYVPLNPMSFEFYIKEGFDIESHRRLADMPREFTERGCYCMLTNHNTDFISQLYADFNKVVADVKRMVNPGVKNRVGQEIIITNYQRYIYGGVDARRNPSILWDQHKGALSGRLS